MDIICRCGHEKNKHDFSNHLVCIGCFARFGGWDGKSDEALKYGCKSYVEDNLSYIENLAKKKGLV